MFMLKSYTYSALISLDITIDDMHMGGDFIFAHGTVAQLSELLQAEFVTYKHET